jgi:hypothetical protein
VLVLAVVRNGVQHVVQPPDPVILGSAKAIYERDEKPNKVVQLTDKK